jgi:hypothetical protein
MTNYVIHSTAAGMLRKEHPATGGSGTTSTHATGALPVGVSAFGVVSKKMRNNL